MTKIAYLDCPTGIAGDMCLGALVHAGVPLEYLITRLEQLGIATEYHLWAESVQRNGQQATKVHVALRVDAVSSDHDRAYTETMHHMSHLHHSPTEPPTATEADVAHAPRTHSHESHSTHRSQSKSDHESHSHASTLHDAHAHGLVRHLPEVERLILAAGLPARAEAWSLAVFRKLAEAEGAIHGVPPEQVHFHEVGATDAIVDIVGTCLGLDWLDIERLYCSPLPTGGGTIRAAHGRLPVPAPAVLKLFELRQVPLYSNGIDREMVTPTGAAIATTLATQFGAPPPMTLQRVGLGAGSISLPLPNILRLWLGESGVGSRELGVGEAEGARGAETQNLKLKTQNSHPHPTPHTPHPTPHTPPPTPHTHPIALLETQIDDLNPQAIGYVYEALFAVGALDVFTQAIGMKKSRPGILLTVVCDPKDVAACEAVLFRETTTLGIRRSLQERTALHREMQSVETAYGKVQVKVAWLDRNQSQPTNVQPEYEDCARLAKQHQCPWREVHRLALEAWYEHHHKA